MDTDIEFLDRQRMKFLKWYLVGFAIFMIMILTRHFFRLGGMNSQPIGIVVLSGLFLSLIIQVISVIRSALLEKNIHQKPHLEAALNNELVKSLTTQSWMVAYFGTSAMTLFFAVTWAFYPICDPVTISLTSIVTGAGVSRAYFYFKYNMS
jgi:hypothetical protein